MRREVVAVAAVVAVLLVGAVGVHAYDASRADRIAEGVRVAGIDVGGLERQAARERLRARLAALLSAPVVVRAAGRRFTLTVKRTRLRADIDAMVEEAIAAGRDGNALTRAVRALVGTGVDRDVEPRVAYDARAVRAFVARVRRAVDRPPRDAAVRFTATGVRVREPRVGLKVDVAHLQRAVRRALVGRGAARTVAARLERTGPRVTTERLRRRYRTVIHINRGAFELRLYKNLRLVKRYPIAVGQVGLETPAGLYEIQNKAVDPAWIVPNSPWAGELAGTVVPPGPANPLKARWMGIHDGAGIHGTADRASIGTNASHGCIRMYVEDVIELYDRVAVGDPVYIA
jgi:lipoprotein-anchoring transpeptidase ErfK/SrfK